VGAREWCEGHILALALPSIPVFVIVAGHYVCAGGVVGRGRSGGRGRRRGKRGPLTTSFHATITTSTTTRRSTARRGWAGRRTHSHSTNRSETHQPPPVPALPSFLAHGAVDAEGYERPGSANSWSAQDHGYRHAQAQAEDKLPPVPMPHPPHSHPPSQHTNTKSRLSWLPRHPSSSPSAPPPQPSNWPAYSHTQTQQTQAQGSPSPTKRRSSLCQKAAQPQLEAVEAANAHGEEKGRPL
jgi:hypothetical protein